MFLHIGNDNIIKESSIIGFFNIECIKNSKENIKIFKDIDYKIDEKTLVLVEENNKSNIFLSNISSITLAKRVKNGIQ